MRSKVIFVAVILCLSANVFADARTLRPLPGIPIISAKAILTTEINHAKLAIASDRAALRKLAGRTGVHSKRTKLLADMQLRRRSIGQLRFDLREGILPKFGFLNLAKLKIGQIGRIDQVREIEEILGHGLALCMDYCVVATVNTLPPGYVQGGYGPVPPAYEKPIFGSVWYMIKGFNIAGITTPSHTSIGCLCVVSGTQTYTTTVGSQKTVFVIEPIKITLEKKAKK